MTEHRGTVPLGDWEALAKQKADRVRRDWRGHRSLTYFLADHYPTVWEKVRCCRLTYKPQEEVTEPGYVKVAWALRASPLVSTS